MSKVRLHRTQMSDKQPAGSRFLDLVWKPQKLSYVLGTGKDAVGWQRVIYARVLTVGSVFGNILNFQAAGAKFGQEGRRPLVLSRWDEAG